MALVRLRGVSNVRNISSGGGQSLFFDLLCLTVICLFIHSFNKHFLSTNCIPEQAKSLVIKSWMRHVPYPNMKQTICNDHRGVNKGLFYDFSILTVTSGNTVWKWVCGWILQEGLKFVIATHLAVLKNYAWFHVSMGTWYIITHYVIGWLIKHFKIV